jgi:putative resolvase
LLFKKNLILQSNKKKVTWSNKFFVLLNFIQRMENEKKISKNPRYKKEKDFVSVGEAATLTGLDRQTIRKMADRQTIKCFRTPSDQRRINLHSLQEFIHSRLPSQSVSEVQRKNFLYARVSSRKQLDELSRQVEYLKRREFLDYSLVTDIASGINFKRPGLSTILDTCLQKTIGNIVIAHKDRLCRFGYELIEEMVKKAGGHIIILDKNDNKSDEQQLSDDLLSIVQVFCCRKMGKRKYRTNKVKDSEDQNIPKRVSEESSQ